MMTPEALVWQPSNAQWWILLAVALSSNGRTLMLYPLTRQGRDGPLVVAYRASVATSHE